MWKVELASALGVSFTPRKVGVPDELARLGGCDLAGSLGELDTACCCCRERGDPGGEGLAERGDRTIYASSQDGPGVERLGGAR